MIIISNLNMTLSKVLFITANSIKPIQPACVTGSRSSILNGYAVEEKIEIAKRHCYLNKKNARA